MIKRYSPDDYLDDDTEGKGLLADNTVAVEGKPYTELEHQWDEGFGYWGGAVNYLDYTDDELASEDGRAEYVNGYNDHDGDGAIDLGSEINFGASVNAAKRDRGAADGALTDMSAFGLPHERTPMETLAGNQPGPMSPLGVWGTGTPPTT